MAITERFSNDDTAKNVTTVGEMISELQRLPPDTPVEIDGGDSVDIVLFNCKSDDAHVSFAEGGLWDNDADDEEWDDDDDDDDDETQEEQP